MDDGSSHLKAYESAVREHGAGFGATLWGSPQTQTLRFEVLNGMAGGLAGQRVLDLGCGDGALYTWMVNNEVPAAYLGLDALTEQVDRGRQLCEGAEFRHVDLSASTSLPSGYDWVVLSGTLNTMSDELVRHVLALAWRAAGVGLAFNFLSDRPGSQWASKPLGPARRQHLPRLIAWALERTPLVACRQDYLDGHDATIVMRHPDRA